MKTNGWRDIGYHWVLEYVNNKLVWRQGRKETDTGAHTKEQSMNSKSIGICVVGNFDKYPPTQAHYEAIRDKIKELDVKYGPMPIEPHSKYATYKSCPGKLFDMKKLVDMCRKPDYKAIIQSKCKFSNPDAVFNLLGTHPFADDLFRKWAESYE
jgi:N-acetyl-anhydromuramyl-L-alanine amidase AmpD